MVTKLLLNVTPQEVRVAVIENDRLAELYSQRQKSRSIVGNIYMGKVSRVLPGMQAAFVDIGLERAAFLYVTDFFDEYGDAFKDAEYEEAKRKPRNSKRPQIQDLLKEGQEVLVQIAKDPIGTKGARLTSHVSLPGRHLVYMPTVEHTGVSRKIDDDDERKRLRTLVSETQTMEGGFIVRTASAHQPASHIIADIESLERQWKKVLEKRKEVKAPAVVHEDLDLVLRSVRDFFTDDIEELIVDDQEAYRSIKNFATANLPKRGRKITMFEEPGKTLFKHYKIEQEIDKALSRKVWLKSGGYLIFDQTEALTAIDVNTGRFVGSKNLEETIIQNNLEAVKEIVAQLRLRNIGGLIILDFIDMEKRSNQNRVFAALEKELANDKAKTNVLKISELGLVEMTRKRTRENLAQQLCEPCANCDAKGFHRSARTVAYTILRKLTSEIKIDDPHQNFEVLIHPKVASILKNEEYDTIRKYEENTGRRVVIREQPTFHPENYQINATGHGATKLVETDAPMEKPAAPKEEE
jgi:ribonuclease G